MGSKVQVCTSGNRFRQQVPGSSLQRNSIAATEKLSAGKSTVRFEFQYDGGGLGKGGHAALYVNDKQVADGRIERTQPIIFSADETADVGVDLGTPVVEAMGAEGKSRFSGAITRVTVDVHD